MPGGSRGGPPLVLLVAIAVIVVVLWRAGVFDDALLGK